MMACLKQSLRRKAATSLFCSSEYSLLTVLTISFPVSLLVVDVTALSGSMGGGAISGECLLQWGTGSGFDD